MVVSRIKGDAPFRQDHGLPVLRWCSFVRNRRILEPANIAVSKQHFVYLLQGSMEGTAWTDLRVHKDEKTISSPGQYASWSISGPKASLPFRMFRVVLTGPTTSKTKPWNLCLCYLELYGYFR
jgi:hypothetical protein